MRHNSGSNKKNLDVLVCFFLSLYYIGLGGIIPMPKYIWDNSLQKTNFFSCGETF